jgi:hypothetical protein
MTLAPFLLAAVFGLMISALLYFVLIWPSREPPEADDDAHDADSEAGTHEPDAGNLDRAAGEHGQSAAARPHAT